MATIELSGLEYQVDHLLLSLQRLKAENVSLRQKLSKSNRECTELMEKNLKAALIIKKIIAHLKENMS